MSDPENIAINVTIILGAICLWMLVLPTLHMWGL